MTSFSSPLGMRSFDTSAAIPIAIWQMRRQSTNNAKNASIHRILKTAPAQPTNPRRKTKQPTTRKPTAYLRATSMSMPLSSLTFPILCIDTPPKIMRIAPLRKRNDVKIKNSNRLQFSEQERPISDSVRWRQILTETKFMFEITLLKLVIKFYSFHFRMSQIWSKLEKRGQLVTLSDSRIVRKRFCGFYSDKYIQECCLLFALKYIVAWERKFTRTQFQRTELRPRYICRAHSQILPSKV